MSAATFAAVAHGLMVRGLSYFRLDGAARPIQEAPGGNLGTPGLKTNLASMSHEGT